MLTALVLVSSVGRHAWAAGEQDSTGDAPVLFDFGSHKSSKEPITITSDTLEFDNKNNIVVYRGDVLAVQADVKIRSDVLTITFEPRRPSEPKPSKPATVTEPGQGAQRIREVIATGAVHIDQGTRYATGGRAVFEQSERTIVLTENPVLHDGQNEVAGERVIVYLDENRSEVKGGNRRVKAVLYPSKKEGKPRSGVEEPPVDAPEAPAQ